MIRRRDAGLTLIELVAAMALFALVAVMGLQILNGILRTTQKLSDRSDITAELSLTLALLRQDLSAGVPMPFYTPAGLPESSLLVTSPGPRLAVSTAGRIGPETAEMGQFQRVEWGLNPGTQTLFRRVWPALLPGGGRQPSPEVDMLDGVLALQVRYYRAQDGWIDWSEIPGDGLAVDLPDAVEVTLVLAQPGPVVVLESFR